MAEKKLSREAWLSIPLAVLCVVLVVVLYAAYVYVPAEDLDFKSPYLKTVLSNFVDTGSCRIHYVHEGTGEKMILVHGASAWLYSYRDNLPALAQFFSVYALDMPGHGYTTSLQEEPAYDLDMMSETLLNFMDVLDIETANLVGHSSGGGWTIHFAHKNPERVRRLILIDSNGLDVPVTLTFRLLSYPIMGELFSNFFTTDDVKTGLEDSFFNKTLVTKEMIREIEAPLTFLDNRKAQYLCVRNQDWKVTEEEMQTIDIPTLVIWGEQDQYLDCGMACRFQEIMPKATVSIINKCGHSAHEERPDKVNRLIIEFIRGSEKG
jgi:pimeloyl-ACP methyl ester carboxylesterase